MGVYGLTTNTAHGSPVYVLDCNNLLRKHWLYQHSVDGRWMATYAESDIAENAGQIRSSRAADLPSEAGLAWEFWDNDDHGSFWHDDPKMTCTDVL